MLAERLRVNIQRLDLRYAEQFSAISLRLLQLQVLLQTVVCKTITRSSD
ncbi:MAG: hypothetical protein OFPI_24320 [Osedax symbiont Rs2]|nr:MAG: hypothetical protein OFPI_24320 [Osedax symbiont Rs2]